MKNITITLVLLAALFGFAGCKDKPNVAAIDSAVATVAPASAVAPAPQSGVVAAPVAKRINPNIRTYDELLEQAEADRKSGKSSW